MTLSRLAMTAALAALLPSFALAQPDYLPSADLHEVGMRKYWQLALPVDPGHGIVDVFLVDDQIYATTADGYVYAVHAYTGTLRWIRRVTTAGYRVTPPCHAAGRTVFVTPSSIVQYEKIYGTPVVAHDLRFPAGSPPVSDGTLLYVGGLNRRFYAIPLDRDFEFWKAGVGGTLTSAPVLDNNTLYFGGGDGRVYSITSRNKALRWIARTGGAITADVVVRREGVYAASRDQSLYLFDREFGGERWRARLSAPLYEAPLVTADTAYQANELDGVVAINTAVVQVEERIRWKLRRGRIALTEHGEHIFVLSRDGAILAVRSADGEIVHEIPAHGFTMYMPVADQPAILVASPDGRLFCARPSDLPLVTAEDVREALYPTPAEPQAPVAAAAVQPPVSPGSTSAVLTASPLAPPLGGKSKISRNWTSQPAPNGKPPGSNP